MPMNNPFAYLLPFLQQAGGAGIAGGGMLPTPPVGGGMAPGGMAPQMNPLMSGQMPGASGATPTLPTPSPLAPGRGERAMEQLLSGQVAQPGQMPLPTPPVPPRAPTIGPEDQMAQRNLGRTSEMSGLQTPPPLRLPGIPGMPGANNPAGAMMNSPLPVPRPAAAQVGPALLGAVNNPDSAAAELAAAGMEPPPLPGSSPVGEQLAKTMAQGEQQKQGSQTGALDALAAVQPQEQQQTPPPAAISPSVLGGQVNPALAALLMQMQPQGQVGPSLVDLLAMR